MKFNRDWIYNSDISFSLLNCEAPRYLSRVLDKVGHKQGRCSSVFFMLTLLHFLHVSRLIIGIRLACDACKLGPVTRLTTVLQSFRDRVSRKLACFLSFLSTCVFAELVR